MELLLTPIALVGTVALTIPVAILSGKLALEGLLAITAMDPNRRAR